MTIRKIILLAVFTATMLTGCFTSSTSGGALGENRRQMFLVGEQEMNEAAAKAYVETLGGASSHATESLSMTSPSGSSRRSEHLERMR